MADIRNFWARVKATKEQLSDANWITSVENDRVGIHGGAVCCADREVAALRIVEKTHRPSTPEEIEKNRIETEERVKRTIKKDQSRGNNAVLLEALKTILPQRGIVMSEEQITQVAAQIADDTKKRGKTDKPAVPAVSVPAA